jgi:amidohydrolase
MVRAGAAHNVIPESGHAAGTIRMLDPLAWAEAESLVRVLVDEIVAPYGVTADVDYRRGVPPVVNEPRSSELLASAVRRVVGPAGQVVTTQSLGGEDFGWYLERVPGAMGRLGTRTPGGPRYDLHQGNIVVDEGATTVAARVLAQAAVAALPG